MTRPIVTKFGGSSVANNLDTIKYIIEQDPNRKVIVVSAPGCRYPGDTKVTDLLIELAQTGDMSLVDEVIERYKSYNVYSLEQLKSELIERIKVKAEGQERSDHIISFGEETMAKIVAKILDMPYIDPRNLIVSTEFGNARFIDCKLDNIQYGVVPGFFGYTEDGRIATVGRGGSDYTGSFIAAMIGADYENFTDIEGVMGINPSLIKDLIERDGESRHVIRYITYTELSELAYQGFRVFQGKALEPAKEFGVKIHIRKTDRSLPKGTYVLRDRSDATETPIVGVAYMDDISNFKIAKFGMANEVGFGEKVLRSFTDHGISWETMHTSVESIAVQVKNSEFKDSLILHGITEQLIAELGGDYTKRESGNLGFLVVVGRGIDYKMNQAVAYEVENLGAQIKYHYFGENSPIVFVLGSKGEEAARVVYEKFVRKS